MSRIQRLRLTHAIWFAGLGALLMALAGPLNSLGLLTQFALVCAGTLAVGIPHGALDIITGEELLAPRVGRWWPVPFVSVYLALAGVVVLLWQAFPGPSLAVFLLLSVYHFGASDTEASGLPKGLRGLEIAARGLLVITLPALAHGEVVTELFSHLAGAAAATRLAEACTQAAVPALLFAAGVWLAGVRRAVSGHENALPSCLELPVVAGLFWRLEPLLAFGVYWCGLHSWRVLSLAAAAQGQHFWSGMGRIYLRSWPITMATLGLAGLAWGLGLHRAGALAGADQLLFVGLAAVNLPHMLLIAVTEARRGIFKS